MSASPLKNPKHEAFCLARAGGASQDEAYEVAGFAPNRSNAARLSANELVVARISHLQRRTAERAQMSRDRAAEILAEIAENPEEAARDRTGALKVLGGWCGWEAPAKVEHSGAITFAQMLAEIREKQ